MIKAIFFDLDGVLIESEEIIYQGWAKTYKKLGYDLPSELFFSRIGMPGRSSYDFFNKALGIKTKLTVDEFHKIHEKARGPYPQIPLVPHAEEILKVLSPNFKLAVVTSSSMSWLKRTLKQIPYAKYFTEYVTREEIKNPKPHPEPYLKALKKLEIIGKEAVVVEDATHGITSAKKAGTTVIARKVEHNKSQDFSQADYVVEDLREIAKIVENLTA